MNSPAPATRMRIGEWLIEPALDQIVCGDRRVKLEPRIMQLLLHLAARPGEVASVGQLLDSVWAGVVVSPESVYQYVAQLRKVLGDDSGRPRYIGTVPRKGYRLIAPVAQEEVGARPSPPPAPADERTHDRRRRRRFDRWRSGYRLALTVLVVGIGVAIWVTPRSWLRPAPNPERVPSVAVLPFADLSEDASNQAFCDGLAEQVLNSLARLPGLRVVARTSTFALRAHMKDAREIGRQLDASHVLEGSVRRSHDRIRVSVQLIDAGSGYLLWSENYDRAYADVMEIQEQIANSVVGTLEIQLPAQAAARIGAKPTLDIGAYELYLLGRHAQHARTQDAAARAIGYQQGAIHRDATFALAYAGLADAYISQFNFGQLSATELLARAQPLIDRALQIDALLPETHAAQGSLHTQVWNLEAAKASLRRATVLNPNFADAHLRLGIALEYDGQPRAALESLRRAARLDPLNFFVVMRECLVLQMLGLYDEAAQHCERSAQLEPTHPNPAWVLGVIAASQGHTVQAIELYRRALLLDTRSPYPPQQASWLSMDAGDRAVALEMNARALQANADGPQSAQIERIRLQAVDMQPAQLREALDRLALDNTAPTEARLVEASLRVVAKDSTGALRTVHVALSQGPAELARLPSIYHLQWGWSSSLDLATVLMRNGQRERALTLLDALDAHLDELEDNGHVSHGFQYLRAAAAALRGNHEEAVEQLRKARDQGWRRAWWARLDPAFDELRQGEKFSALLASVVSAE